MTKIVSIYPILIFPEHIRALKKLGKLVLYDSAPKNNQEIVDRLQNADVAIVYWSNFPKSVIEKLKRVKMICVAAAGYDFIDVEAATRKGIVITHCPGHNAESVAEHTVGLMLGVMRLSGKASNDFRNGKFHSREYKGKELKGKTVGIIGYGLIGKRVAEILKYGFKAKIIFINSVSSRIDLEKLLQQSDFISINAPLNKKTRNLLSYKEFELMKSGVVIVNTGRGEIIDEKALLENLNNRKVFAAGLDVLAKQSFETSNPLLTLPNVIVTPHIGWNTTETDYRLSAQLVEVITAYVEGKPTYIIPEQRKL